MIDITTENAIDEEYGVNFGVCEFPGLSRGEKKVILSLTETLPGFSEIRWRSLENAGGHIVGFIEAVKAFVSTLHVETSWDERRLMICKGGEYKAKLDGYKLMLDYISDLTNKFRENLAFTPMFQAEKRLFDKAESLLKLARNHGSILGDWETALRLMCLEGAVGVEHKNIQCAQEEIVAEFGLMALEVLINLERLNILSGNGLPGWRELIKDLACNTNGDAFVAECHGFAPVSVRIVEKVTRKLFNGKWIEILKRRGIPVKIESSGEAQIGESDRRTVLVFFVGGVTLSEVAHLRRLGKVVFNDSVQFVVGSTNAVNSKKMMQELCPGLRNRPVKQIVPTAKESEAGLGKQNK
jgi:hypothetical protein